MGVARLLPEAVPFVGGLGCWPLGVHDEPKDEAPEVEDNGEDDPSWMEGEEAELGTVVDDNNEEVVDKSAKKSNRLLIFGKQKFWEITSGSSPKYYMNQKQMRRSYINTKGNLNKNVLPATR